MSTPLFPLAVWLSGTNENSIPANDNALRVQVLMAPAIDFADSEPGSPNDDDIYVIGDPWGGFTANNAVIYKGGVWLEWEAFEGWVKVIDGQQYYFDGSDWALGGGAGIPDAPNDGRLYGRKDAAWAEVPSGGGGSFPATFYVEDFSGTDAEAIQAAIDAAAAAGGGRVVFADREYVIDGPLKDTARGNAQILLPSVGFPAGDQITIELVGPFAPTPVASVIGDIPVASGGAVLRSTLTDGSGGSMIGGWGPVGSFGNFTIIQVVVRNITLRMPPNPTHSAADFTHVTCVEIDNVVADAGSYYVEGLAEPTTSSSYGIKMPMVNNGARTTVGTINVIGFYTGVLGGEHLEAQEINAWGCRYAYESPEGIHAAIIQRLMSVHCRNGIHATGGNSYLQVDQFNIEHATSGWWAPVNDIDDPNNYLVGNLRWHVVKAASGVDDTFTKSGGGSIACIQLGDNAEGGGGTAFPVVVNSTLTSSSVFPADAGAYIRFTATGAKTMTVLPDASRPLPANGEWHFRNVGTGNLTVSPGSGVSISPPAGGSLVVPPGGTVTLKRVAANAFDLLGQTVSA